MASIYTCPDCRRRYTIGNDGDYLCECGKVFSYPPVLSRERACFISIGQAQRAWAAAKSIDYLSTADDYPAISKAEKPGFAGMLVRALNFTLF